MEYRNSGAYARKMDADDELATFRDMFYIPEHDGRRAIYFCGNSLGLQPETVKPSIDSELNLWKELAVGAHFKGNQPWIKYSTLMKPMLAKLCGAAEEEIVAMNSLTINLHLMLISFYRPAGKKYKILIEASAFPSDYYALVSQVKIHGYNPEDAIIEVQPQAGSFYISTANIVNKIEAYQDELALILLSGVQYISGQFFNIEAITKAAHRFNITIGFDLAHAIGNLPLRLSEWDVDFAVWCSYKYLNAGPGNVGGLYIHKKYAGNFVGNRLNGWWGNEEKTRFLMNKHFVPSKGADGWQLSNGNILGLSALKASLEIIENATIEKLRIKSILLTGYLEFLLKQILESYPLFQIITPANPEERGCQVSLYFEEKGKEVFDKLLQHDIVVDWREPGVIRVSPVPLYNTFGEVYHFGLILKNILANRDV